MENPQNDEADADHYTIMRMGELLAGIAVALKGPEEACKRHGYQDLPQLVQAKVFEVEMLKQQIAAEAPTWTAIADEKPPTMQDVLFAGEYEGKTVIHLGYLSWRNDRYVILTVGKWTPTHWRYLPMPPK